MHIKNKRPILLPAQYHAEFGELSKAALMDLAWHIVLSSETSGSPAIDMLRHYTAQVKERRRAPR